MDLSLTATEQGFRDQLRDWLDRNLTAEFRELHRLPPRGEGLELRREWQRRLHQAGYVGITWPREYGGRGGSPVEEMIVNQEMALARAPDLVGVIAIYMAGPTIIAEGSDDQKARYLGPMLSAGEIWCQGFSEPNSGSDLASLQTRAEPDGDTLVVNGQKVWSSFAHVADWCILLTRTEPRSARPHAGLTYLILDMHSPGVEVRPLRQMTGDAEFNEIYLTDVRVPAANVVGAIGDGWRVAMTTLMHERASFGVGMQIRTRITLDELLSTVRGSETRNDPVMRQRLAQLFIEVEAMRLNGYRGLTGVLRGEQPGPEGSINKLMWSEVNQRITETAMAVRGPAAMLADDGDSRWAFQFLRARANSIEGGTSEVLRNILAERVLGLPRSR
jgi:alkylation response protein AidB-like acyl-CoA dehydrogenase